MNLQSPVPTGSYVGCMDAIETQNLLKPVLADLAEVIDDMSPTQLAAPTPCTEMDVAALRDHVLTWTAIFAGGYADAEGNAPMGIAEGFTTPADPGAALRESAATLDGAVRGGAAERPLSLGGSAMPGDMALSMILWEYVVHGWDLATATGTSWAPDDAAVNASLEFAPGMLTPDFQGEGKAFAPRVDVAEDADPLDRLLALSGRNPTWTA